MSITLNASDTALIHQYAEGVLARATCHATNVFVTCHTVLGCVLAYHKPGSVSIKQYSGSLANVLWFSSKRGLTYAVAYNHKNGKVEVRARHQNGPALAAYEDIDPAAAIVALFQTL